MHLLKYSKKTKRYMMTLLNILKECIRFRYPSNGNDFYASRLPGTFEEDKAGTRLKLATPMTWETQIAM